ncbi:MAG: hypothetical protein R3D51_00150 [Hyphomicrobiaceae bacterium]
MDYYDGPISGIALRQSDQSVIFFQAVASDIEYRNRVYAVTTVNRNAENLRSALTNYESQKEPFWLPSEVTNTAEVHLAWRNVESVVQTSSEWRLVECHDPLDVAQETEVAPQLVPSIRNFVRDRTIVFIATQPMVVGLLDRLQTENANWRGS